MRNTDRGMVSFGFEPTALTRDAEFWRSPAGHRELRLLLRDEATCSKKLNTAARLSKIIADDRSATDF